ncbi:conserved protein [Tepidicaulis marinus]|uniref:Conserved protein n=2 Tax=Tepidicaulis marinus TaxID=1333998 RepID=A0A081BEZ9_9HYPH|nr:conserved protein [Tepidicaulis marinus]
MEAAKKAVFGCLVFSAVALVHSAFLTPDLWLLGFFGAAITLVIAEPESRFTQPRALLGGVLISFCCGLLAAHFMPGEPAAIVTACSAAILLMTLLRVQNPPAGAAAAIAASGTYDWTALLAPTATGMIMIVLAHQAWKHLNHARL